MKNNRLSLAETERLVWLAEEMGETIQAIGKILRHGYESVNPAAFPPRPTNQIALERELGDVQFCVDLLCTAGDLQKARIYKWAAAKAFRVKHGG